jgi:hypothetical protein
MFLLDNNLVPPKVAHLQIGMVQTFFFLVHEDRQIIQSFSEEGKLLWEKYFCPHTKPGSCSEMDNYFKIYLSWYNFISMMILYSDKFN